MCSGPSPSNSRRPSPSSTGTWWTSSSSSTPAPSASCAVRAPWTSTFPVARGRLGACHRIRHIVDDDRAGRHQLGVDLAVDARRPDPAAAVGQPLVQALPAVPEPVADVVRRTGDEPVDIDM
jgi:hypothetical protein